MAMHQDNSPPSTPFLVRREGATDRPAVRALVAAAFEREDEALLVERLRPRATSLVAERDGAIVGHVMTSPMRGVHAVGLAPLAVAAPARRCGIGAALVRGALEAARGAGWDGAFVLGDPAYYGRFGFRADLAARYDCPYGGPHLMALALRQGALPGGGRIDYDAAFAG